MRGTSAVLFLNSIILSFFTLSVYLLLGGEINSLIIWTILFIFLEALVFLMVVILLSLLTNVTMTIIYGLVIYVSGHALSSTMMNKFVENSDLLSFLISLFSWILPNFSRLNIKDYVLYEQTLDQSFLIGSSLYAVAYFVLMFVFSSLVFKRKDLV